MKNEVLDELWKVKEQIASEFDYKVEKLAKELRKKEKDVKVSVIDLTLETKRTENKVPVLS